MGSLRIRRELGYDRILPVEAGKVICPRRGPIGVERCWVCPAYDGLSGSRREGVICRADPTDIDVDIRPMNP
jgi:hypothetical protein